jgi:hypothetical protein
MFNLHLPLLYNVVSVGTGYNKIIWDLGESLMLGEQECN